MFSAEDPVLRLVRGCKTLEALYAFGDASAEGFGASWLRSGTIKFRYGVWGIESDGTSSNYREFRNLVDSLRVNGRLWRSDGPEILLFTDNTTSEHIAKKKDLPSLRSCLSW